MNNIDNDVPQELADNQENHSLWLTDRLLLQLRSSSKIGVPLMVLCILLGVSVASLSLYWMYWRWSQIEGDFYLLERKYLFMVIRLLSTLLIFYSFTRGIIEGYKSWRFLRSSQTDDDALLEGTERLGKMFRWLTLCGVIYFGTMVLQLILRSAM